MCTSAAHNSRPRRESLRKRLGLRVSDAIAERDGWCCAYCGATAHSSGAPLQLDHLTPRSQGGSDDPTNLITCCRSCNSRRQDMSLSDWSRDASHWLRFTARSIRAQARRSLHV